MWIFAIMLFGLQTQTVTVHNPAGTLYERIFNEQRPVEKLKLISDFETKYISSPSKLATPAMKAQVLGFAADIYQQQNNPAKTVEYGEKALQYDPDNIHILVLLAHQYSLTSDKTDRAVEYARRAIAQCQKLQNSPQAGFSKTTWSQYLKTNQDSAQATLNYIQTRTQRLLQTRRAP